MSIYWRSAGKPILHSSAGFLNPLCRVLPIRQDITYWFCFTGAETEIHKIKDDSKINRKEHRSPRSKDILWTFGTFPTPLLSHYRLPLTAFIRIGLASDAPWISGICKSVCLNDVWVTTMEELDQGSLHPSIKHPKTDMYRPWFYPLISFTLGGHFIKELSRKLTLFAIRNLYMTAPVHVASTHELIPRAQAWIKDNR